MSAVIPPLSKVRKNLRVKWYRCPIERKKLSELMRRSNWHGTRQALGHFGLWLCTGVLTYLCFSQGWWIGFAAALFLHGTVGSFFKGLAVHELGHGTVFRSRWLNRLFLRFFSLIGWWNYHEYAMSHTYHHRYTLHPEGDREVVLPCGPTLWILVLVQLFTVNIGFRPQCNAIIPTVRRILFSAFNRYDDAWIRDLYTAHPEARPDAVRWARLVLGFHMGVTIIFVAIGQPILVLLVSCHLFIGNWLRYFVGMPMHCGLRDNVSDFRLCVRSIRLDPISQFLYWHMNWHTEHHMFAGVPCYNLAELHREVRKDMPTPRSLIGAWREMRDTWRRQREDPNYQFDTPLPATAQVAETNGNAVLEADGEDRLETSIGELAPKVLK